jgi:hypothetical protein
MTEDLRRSERFVRGGSGDDRSGRVGEGPSPRSAPPGPDPPAGLPTTGSVMSAGFRPAATGEMRVAVGDGGAEMSSIRSDGNGCPVTDSDNCRFRRAPLFLSCVPSVVHFTNSGVSRMASGRGYAS